MDRATIKRMGKDNVRKQWGELLLALVLVEAAGTVAALLTLGIGSLVVTGPLDFGLTYLYYKQTQGEQPGQKMLLEGFKQKFGDSFLAGLLLGIIEAIPAVIGVIIGLGSLIRTATRMAYGYYGYYGDYNSVFKQEADAYLQEKYADYLTEDYAAQIDAAAENFILTEDGVKFFFNSGTVASADQGAISMTIPYEKFDGVIRTDIGKRIIDPNKPMVALTYDDGPSVDNSTDRILDVMEKYDVVCTFFELGERVDEEGDRGAELLQRELKLGCEVGTHSYSHPNLYELDTAGLQEQAQKSIDAITRATGQPPTIMRPPYGNGNDEIAQIFGLPSINWDVDTLDWSSRNADAVIEEVHKIGNLDGCVVLMHSIYSSSAEATERLVPELVDQGYQLVTVSELLQYKYGYTPIEVKHYGYFFRPESGE